MSVTKDNCEDIKNNVSGRTGIKLHGITNEEIEFDFKCEECECADHPTIEDAEECSSNGTFVCGGCDCKKGFTGKHFV